MKRLGRLGTKVILVVMVLILLVGLSVSGVIYKVLSKTTLDLSYSLVDRYVNERYTNLESFFADLEGRVANLSKSTTIYKVLTTKVDDDSILETVRAENGLLAVYLLDLNGSTILSTDTRMNGQNYGFRKYFKDAVLIGSGFEVALGVSTGQFGYYFSHGIYNNQGILEGVLVLKIGTEVVEKLLVSDNIDYPVIPMLTDEFGVVMHAVGGGDRVLRTLGGLSMDERKYLQTERYVNKPLEELGYAEVFGTYQQASEAMQKVVILDDTAKTREFWIRKIGRWNLFWVVEINPTMFESLTGGNSVEIALLVLGSALICGFLIVIWLRKVFGPLNELKRMATSIGEGKYGLENKIKTGDELEILGETLETIGGKVSESVSQLEQKVKSRTQELLELNRRLDFKVREAELSRIDLDKQNQKMYDTQKAVINLLEDTREYDAELKKQKQEVEELVEKRTMELESEKSRLLSSVEAMNRGYLLADLNGKVILTNKVLLKILEKDNPPVTVFQLGEFLNKVNDVIRLVKSSVEDGLGGKLENVTLGTKMLIVRIQPVKQTDKAIGVLVMIEDFTEKWVLERSRDEFFSIASHELRTPLTAIKGNTSMIKDMILPKIGNPELEAMVDDIHEGSVRLLSIVNDFLALSRLEQGKAVFKQETFDLGIEAEGVVGELKSMADSKRIKLIYEKNILMVKGDKNRAREILVNLIGNAVKYTEVGEVKISLVLEKEVGGIRVTDSGRGVAIENQKLLFRKFQQAGESLYTRDTTKSTGLGLYISKMLAEGMGGQVYLVKSQVGKGSEFAFELPLALC